MSQDSPRPVYTPETPETMLGDLAGIKRRLLAATDRLATVSLEATVAKRNLADDEAERVAKGVEGANDKQRAANLAIATYYYRKVLEAAEDKVTLARNERDRAMLEFDLYRYQVRTLEAFGGRS